MMKKAHRYLPVILVWILWIIPIQASPNDSSSAMATENILALNTAMFPIYDRELQQFKTQLMNTYPVIVALFSTEGGRFTLYRPGHPPLTAPFPPVTYQIAKSIGHSIMATYEMTKPYIHTSTTDTSWQPQMSSFLSKVRLALNGLDALKVPDSDKAIYRQALTHIEQFLTKSLHDNSITEAGLNQYAESIRPLIPKLIKIAASAQVQHYMAVLAEWKKLLGDDWNRLYAMTNTLGYFYLKRPLLRPPIRIF
jgi:hypothetical protein